MRITFLFSCLLTLSYAKAQENGTITEVIDELTMRWDQGAINLKTYQGIQEFCLNANYQYQTNDLLDEIHHWDTLLYFIVQKKFDVHKDKEAAKTLLDIEKLETEYSTLNFKKFIQEECSSLKVIEKSFDASIVNKYEKEIRLFEKELVKYVNTITFRIDIIREHMHHLKI